MEHARFWLECSKWKLAWAGSPIPTRRRLESGRSWCKRSFGRRGLQNKVVSHATQ